MSDRAMAILDELGSTAHVELLRERLELLRFGESRVTYQHSEERDTLRVRLLRDGREAWGITSDASPHAVAALRRRLERNAAALPAGEPVPLLVQADAQPQLPTYHASTERATADDRLAAMLAVAAAMPPGARLGGSVTHSVAEVSVVNSSGLQRHERRSRAAVTAVAERGGRSSYLRCVRRDAQGLGLADASRQAAGLLADMDEEGLEPGRYPAYLAPQAVITLLATLGFIGFGAAAYVSGESPFASSLGEQVLDPAVTITDDGTDAAGLPTGFDTEGALQRRVPLVEAGRLAGMVHDVRTATAAGVETTGHAVPPGWRFGGGPSASHLVMAPGRASRADLLAAVGDGLAIQRVDYVRVVQPRQGIVTGTTRDATMLVRDGRIVAGLPSFRFTLALPELFARLTAVGSEREVGDTVFMESVVAPGMVVRAFPVDEIAQR
jgi:predicted Zn-dependent protease